MSKGFGDWFEEKQRETSGKAADTSFAFFEWGQEKKNDGDVGDAESQQNLLSDASSWLSSGFESIKVGTGLSSSPQEQQSLLFGLSYQTRFKGFVATILMASVFFMLAFFIGLPTIVLRPHKFALCFTLGSMLYMASFALLKGPMAHLQSMITMDRLPFTVSYVGSMGLTLYSALVVRSYVLVILSSGLQMATLVYYMLSFLPGGTAGARVFIMMFTRTLRATLGASYTILSGCLKCVMN